MSDGRWSGSFRNGQLFAGSAAAEQNTDGSRKGVQLVTRWAFFR